MWRCMTKTSPAITKVFSATLGKNGAVSPENAPHIVRIPQTMGANTAVIKMVATTSETSGLRDPNKAAVTTLTQNPITTADVVIDNQ